MKMWSLSSMNIVFLIPIFLFRFINIASFTKKDNTGLKKEKKKPWSHFTFLVFILLRHSAQGNSMTVLQSEGGLSKMNVVTLWYVYSMENLFQCLIRSF